MLLLNPPAVRLGPHTLSDVTLLAIDRAAERTIHEHDDTGPHATFADVPEHRVTIRIVRTLLSDDFIALRPGDRHQLSFHASPAASDAGRRRISAAAVITSITHQVSNAKGAQQTITLLAVSDHGATDPITSAPIPHSAD